MKHPIKRSYALLLILLLLALLLFPPFQARAYPMTDAQTLQQAWQLAQTVGRFHYQTDVMQTTHPAVTLRNANRHAKTKQFQVAGEMDIPNEAMRLQLQTNRAGQRQVLDLKIEAGQAYGRLHTAADWTPIDQSTDLFAPGGDPLGFLVAAENVEEIGKQRLRDSGTERFSSPSPATNLSIAQSLNLPTIDLLDNLFPAAYLASLTRYRFDLNGVKYAEFMRTQMEDALRQKGELPTGMKLELVRQYVGMTGSGEIWVNAKGLPVRQLIQLQFPPENANGEWIEAAITTSFSQWQHSPATTLTALWQQPDQAAQMLLQLAGLTPHAFAEAGTVLLFGLVAGSFALLVIYYRRSRLLYASVTLSLISSMLAVPVFNAQQVYAFSEQQQTKAAANHDEKVAQEQLAELQADQKGWNFDPQRNPIENTNDELRIRNQELRALGAPANYELRNARFATSCDTTADTDCDDDGLSNEVETNKLGTDPYAVDSDNDYISDKAEVQGFTFGGKQWYLDPLNPDSNGDGLIDSLECPGVSDINLQTDQIDSSFVSRTCLNSDSSTTNSDLVPDVFDFDNDGDGVPDTVDDSPYSVVGSTSSGLTDGKLNFNLTFTGANKPIYVDFTVRPTNSKHLWYTNNVLDWPSNDSKGQITRVFDTTYADTDNYSTLSKGANGDLLLLPLLEFEITYNAANPSAGLPIASGYSAAAIHDYSDLTWLDTDALDELGISVNEGTDGKSLLLWVPLSLAQDDVGDTPVAWEGRMLYRPLTGLSNLGKDQSVRLVWMVQALVDTCDTSSMGSNDYDTWCADKSHWTTGTSVIQTYYDDFMVTGLSVREDHGAKVAIIAEPKNVGNSNYEDRLWHLADSLEDAFLGAEGKADSSRLGVADIATYAATWGVSGLTINTYTLDNQLDLASVASTYSTNMLNSAFGSAVIGDSASLLFAGEETARSAALTDAATSISGNTVKLTLTGATLATQANLRWAPYQYKGAQVWDTLDLESYLDTLDGNLQSVFTNSQIDLLVDNETVADYPLLRAGASGLAQNYYLSLYSGLSKTVAEDGNRFSSTALGNYTLGSTEPATAIVKTLLAEIQNYYADLAVVDGVTTSDATAANSLAASFATSLTAILAALGNVAQGNVSTALSLALSELANYYKTANVATTQFTDVGSITAAAWSSTVAYAGSVATGLDFIYGIVSAGMAAYTILWGVRAFNAYSSYMALANFTHFQPGASNPTAALTYAAKADSVVKTNVAWAVVTFVITVAIIWTLFALGKYSNHLERNAAIVKAVADTVVALIMAVIAAIPVFGWIIVGVVSLISALMMIVCAAVGVESGSAVDRWVCGGLTGALSQALVYAIYDQYIVPDLNDSDRLSIALNTPTLSQKLDDSGYLAGNQLTVSATVTNTISKAKPTGLGSKEHFGYDLDDLLKKSTFAYTLQTTKTDRHASLKAGALDWTNKTEVFYPSVTIDFDSPGLNQNLPLYLTESFVAPALECWGFLIQVCGRSDYKDSFHTYLGEDIVFDILPATLDDFYALTLVKNKSYRLGWDSQFPTLIDADGDGLVSKAKGGADPDDKLWDTDSDGLSDFWELENGFDPENNDYDGDGLYDYWEAFYNTDPNLADSDRDGLTDSEEFFHSSSQNASVKDNATWRGGWTFVYAYSGSTKLQTSVNADPNDYDSDDDTIGDRLEYVYGYNPNLASVLNVLSLDTEVSSAVVAPAGTIAYTATVKNELDNRVANGLLQAEFPVDTVQKTQVMATLYPQDSTTINGTVTAPSVSATTATSLTLRAGAIIDEVDTGRVLWLHLNENANVSTFTDDAQSENGPHDATCSGTACPGANGSFLNFDGSNDLLTISHDTEFNLTNFTASLWVKLDTIKAQTFLAKGTTGLTIGTTNLGQAYAALRLNDCTTPVTVRSSALLVAGSWHNLVATYNGTTLAFYLNGVSAGSASAASLCTNSSSLTLGSSNGGNYFDGQMDEVELYTEGKSAAEVATLAEKPVFYLPGYRTALNGGYQSNDESEYRATTVACSASASNNFSCPSEAVGIAGDSFVFNQSHGLQVSGSDLLDLDAVDGSFSMALWLYPESGYTPDDNHLNNYGQMILGNDDNGWQKAYPSLYIKGNKLIVRFGHANGNGYCEATSSDIFSYNTWQYLTMTFDGSQFKAYIGDTLKSTFSGTNCAGQALYATTAFYIGNGRSPALYFTQLETDDDPQNDEAFLWSDETLLNNGYDAQQIIWRSVTHDIDANETIAINKWAYNTDGNFSFILCNEDTTSVTQGCTGNNDYFTFDNGSTTRTLNFYDSLGAKRERVYNAHGDGSGDRHTWYGWLSYKLYNNAFKGQLDEIKLYRTALSADAVSAAYNGSVHSLELTFDEAPGQDIFSDSSGNDYAGTCASTACPDSGIPGRDNQAGRFDGGVADDDGTDGVADYIKLQSTDLLGLKDSSFTVLAWVKPDSLTADRAILGTDTTQNQKGLHLILRNGKPYFGFYNMDTAGATTIATDQWTHLAWRYDKDTLTQSLFVNGVLDAQGTGKAPFLGTGPVYLGRALGGNAFDGLIDDLVIVKEALTDDEIADVMQEAPTLNLHLDEDLNATRFVNDSLYGNDATCASASAACPQAGSKGQMREAPVFDGNDLLTTNLTGYVADPRNISVAFWVKPTQTKSTVQYLYQSNPFNLFLKANSTDLGVDVGYSSNNSTCSVGSTADLSVSLQKNQWNHVVVTLASTDTSYTKKGTLTVYINGAAQTAATKTYTCPSLTTINLGQNFEGSLDELLLYNSVLDDETVQSLYAYQSAWYDLRYQQLITIDADDPLLSIEMSADYLDYQAYWFTFSAVDTGSSVATVQVKLTKPDNTITTGYATASADSNANNAWLYEFTPTSSGRYILQVTATDAVGNSSSASKTFYVDDTAPTITLNSNLTSAILTTTTGVATNNLALAGTVSDPGSPASGVVTNTVSVDLLDHQDVSVSGIQYTTVTGSAWQITYPFTTLPYGQYRATLHAADLAGNAVTTAVGTLAIDDLGPTADIALSSSVISESVGTLNGVVTDIPYPSEDRARYLHFEEGSSTTTFVDSTSNGVTVTCTNCPATGATGQSGRAATFDGVNDRLTLSAPFDPAASKFTAATWFKVADLVAQHTVLAQADGTGTGRAWLLVTTAGNLASDLGGSRLTSTASVAVGQWHHAALTYDGTTLSLYLDGSLTAQTDRSLESSDGELVLGADGTQTQGFFAGLLDEMVLYHRALSAEELYDIAHPLATTIANASLRFRHGADGDQSAEEGTWYPVTLSPSSGASFATWQYPLPAGLEGPYKIDLKATDSAGNSSYIPGVWSGDIDTLAPRISFSYTLLGDAYMQVECLADDYNVTLDGWECPAADVTEVSEAADWFVDLFDPYTRTTSLQSPLSTLARAGRVSGALTACDEVGHCTSQTVANPSVTGEASAIVTPSGATTYNGLDPIALVGYLHSANEVRAVDVTIDGVTIYALTWGSGITEATWSTVWTPPKFGAYSVEATMTNGLGQLVSDPVNTVLTVVAPELTVDKMVTPSSRLHTGDAITYTVVFANSGDAAAANVLLSDTLPSAVNGSNLAITRDLASGERVTYTIPAVVAAGDAFTVTNTALLSHTWQQRTNSASFTRCDDLLVTNANDSGVGSLRQAISDACTTDAVIRFAGDFNIYLNSTLSINKGLTIDGEDHTIVLSGDTGNNGSRNVQVFSIGASGVVTLTSLQVVSGTAVWGGGIANAGALVVADSYFRDNYSNSNLGGGAIYNSKELTVTGSTFVKNQSSRGGALFNGGTATLINSTLTQNSANEGSGIHNRGTLTLRNVTAVAGANLHNWSGTLALYNTLIANNGFADCYGGGTVAANVNNLIRTGNCGAAITSDPVLGALTAFPSTGAGNEQWVMPLLPGSPALNAGHIATCTSSDQRGAPRTAGCDIGAFQSQGFTFTLGSGDNQATLIKNAFSQPLAFTVTAQSANEPVSGGKVTLTAPQTPASGGQEVASLQSSSQSLTLGSNGLATTIATANGVTGAYTVTASIGAANANLALWLTNRSPDLVITKAVTPTSVVGGDLVTYTLAFSNTGDLAATNVTITDTLPSGVAVQDIQSSGTLSVTNSGSSARLERFTIATFPAGASGLITLTAALTGTVTTGDILTNTATIGWSSAEEDLSDNRSRVSNTIPCQPAISVTNGNNSGGGSLRQALANLCDGGTITFAGDTTIYLDSVLALQNTLTIDGDGHAVTISGDSGHDSDRDVQIFTISTSGVVTLRNLSVISGTAEVGGAINNAGALTLDQVTLQDNRATIGGALYNRGTVTLTAVALQSNNASDSGGALYNTGSATVDSAMLTSNQATNNGTIYNDGQLRVENSTFAYNNSRRGGGLYNSTGYTATVTNSTFGHNGASEGGAVHNRGVLTVTNSTLANNSGYGSAIHNWTGTLYLRNSLLTGTCINQGTLASSVHNFVSNGSCSAAYSGTPYLSALGAYGGPTTGAGTALQTFALLPGSPAFDRGDAAYCPAPDQRGISRYGTCDIGAFESQGFTMVYADGSNQIVDAGLTFSEPLAVTITANAADEPVGPGGNVTFAAPTSGASVSTPPLAATTNLTGASPTVTANRIAGSYVVTATAYGVTTTTPVTFSLTNNTCNGATVTNANDSGAGSLRQAISTVCPGGVITFDNDYTIYLSSTLTINKVVTINGAGYAIIISGDTGGNGSPDLRPAVIGASGVVTLTHLSLMHGTATTGSALANGGALVLDTVTVANNYAAATNSANLGTLYNTGTLTVKNSTFAYNETYRGGGIYHQSGTATVTNSTFAENTVTEGGGIYNRSTLSVINSTFADNTTRYAEGIQNAGTLTLINSLFKGKALNIPNCSGNASPLRLNNKSDDPFCGTSYYSTSLRPTTLGDHGGAATGTESAPQTIALQASSSAINAGNAAYCPATDQRGYPRLGACDVGATEWQGYRLVVSGGDNQAAGLNNPFSAPLQVTLVAAESGDTVPSGRTVTFSAPTSAASLDSSSFSATTDSSNMASANVMANGSSGSYVVTATASDVITPVTFALTNDCGLVTVTNDSDSGAGSLRQAISEVCDGGTITFADDYTIYLDSTLAISKTLTIDGVGHTVTVSGDSNHDSTNNVRVLLIEASGVVTLSNLNVVNGFANDDDGAGLKNDGVLTLVNSTVRNNLLTGDGSGAGLTNDGTLTIRNSTFRDNTALDSSDGGGLTNAGTATIVNSTFSGNQAAADGGAIRNVATMSINNSTLSANSADSSGGGLYNSGTLTLHNTIIANSTSGGDCVDSIPLTANSNNLIADGSCSPALSGDPLLSTLGNYTPPSTSSGGASTSSAPQTFALLPGSPALDAGDDATCETTDQRGYDRVGVCDIGATESQGFTWVMSGGNDQQANRNANFAQPLQVTLVASDTNLLLSDQSITFTAPITGAGLDTTTFTALSDSSGVVAAPVTANNITGTYVVTATALHFSPPLTFTLTNLECYNQLVTNDADSGPGSLRQAVADACAGARINFADDYTIYLDSTISIDKPLTIDGAEHAIIVSGDSNNDGGRDVRVFLIEESAVVTMTRLAIVDGSDSSAGTFEYGAGIKNAGTLTLNQIILANHIGRRFGGALYNNGTLTVNDSAIVNNDGGAYGGGLLNYATATINHSFIAGNQVTDWGGGILNYDTLTLVNSALLANEADSGGGLYGAGSSTTISNSTFTANTANLGGALYNYGNATLSNSTVSGNTAVDYGGGIHNMGNLTLVNSTISENEATFGGGIFHEGYSAGEGDPNENSTLTFVNTIIANSISGGDCVNSFGIVTDNGHNLIGDGALVVDGGCLDNATSLSGDPWLAPLWNYGGDTETHGLRPNSAAINAGDAASCPATDQRGKARLDVCDIGAFESQGFTLRIMGGDAQTTLVDTPFAEPLDIDIDANDEELPIGEGQIITLTAPATGASLASTIITATTNPDYFVSVVVTANQVAGTYGITATVNNGDSPLFLTLTNTEGNSAPALDAPAQQIISETYPLSFTVTANDPDGDGLTFSLNDAPDGAALDADSGFFTWTPTADQGPGVYTMTVTVTDDGAPVLSDSTSLVITVLDIPLALPQAVTTDEEQAVDFALFAVAANAPLTYTLVTSPSHGTLSGAAPDLIYTPDPDYAGSDGFTFYVSDGLAASQIATVTLTVNPINEAPTTVGQSLITDEETPLTITLSAADPDGDILTYTVEAPVQNGVLSGSAPNLVYTPDAEFAGDDSFTFTVSDGISTTAEATITITVTAVDDTPIAADQQVTVTEDTVYTITLTGSDQDSTLLDYHLVATPDHGAVNAIGATLVYTPELNYTGADRILFNINDASSYSNNAVVTITVVAVNDAPIATSGAFTTAEDQVVALQLTTADPEGDALTYTIVTAPQHGEIGGIAPNLVYTPTADFNGSDSFTFQVSDGLANSSIVTVTLVVTPANDAPVALDQVVNTDEDQRVAFTLTAFDTENDGVTYTVASLPVNGTLGGIAPNLVYTPTADFVGSDSLTFTVTDGVAVSAPATIYLVVDGVNDTPTATAQSVSTPEDTPFAITLQGHDQDGDVLAYSIITRPAQGVVGGGAPNLIYTPTLNYNGRDSFTFRVTDGTTNSALATVAITVTGVNDAPVADSQTITTSEESSINLTLTGADVDNGVLTYTVLTAPANGTLGGLAPNLVYTPTLNYNGSDSFTFVISDGITTSLAATVTIVVTGVNDAPIANSQTVSTTEETPVAITLTGSDAEGDPITYTVATQPFSGTLAGIAPNLVYTPSIDFNGDDTFTFQVNDGLYTSMPATVTITVNGVNDAPTAKDQAVTTAEETPLAITLTGSDRDGDGLTYSVVMSPTNGVLGGTAPNLVYTPTADFNGSDSLIFAVSDGSGTETLITATVVITVTGVNDAPMVDDQSMTIPEDTALAITLAGRDADGDPLSYAVVTRPLSGTLGGIAPNLVYTPTANFNGTDSFTFFASDGLDDALVATVAITVTPVNDLPVAKAGAIKTYLDTPVTIMLSSSDIDSTVLTYTVATQPSNGSLEGIAPNLVYTPTAGFTGIDHFTFAVTDNGISTSRGASAPTATITITVLPLNNAPTVADQSATTDEDTNVMLALTGTDPDGDRLTYTVVKAPQHGAVSGVAPDLLYAPADEYGGNDFFTFMVSDGITTSQLATVSLTINAVNDSPSGEEQTVSTNEDTPVTITLTGGDIESTLLTYTVATQPLSGTLGGLAPNLVYTPAANFNGTDAFTFVISDGITDSVPATVTVVVTPVNDAPVATGQGVTTTATVPVSITLTGTDIEGAGLTYLVITQPLSGTLGGIVPHLVYTPNLGFAGTDHFTFVVNDGQVDSTAATVLITVTSNTLPTATPTVTPTPSATPSVTPTPTTTATATATETATQAATVVNTPTATASATVTGTPIQTATATPTTTATATAMPTVTPTPTATVTATSSPTSAATSTILPTTTPTATATPTMTATPTSGSTATATTAPTATVTVTATPTPLPTPTATQTGTGTPWPSATPTPSPTTTPTGTVRPTVTANPSATATMTVPATPTATATATPTFTATATATPTDTAMPTSTNTETGTATATATLTPIATSTPIPTATATSMPTVTPTFTATLTPTPTASSTPSATPTATVTPTPTAPPTMTDTATETPTASPTPLPTPTTVTGPMVVDLDFTVTLGIWGLTPQCIGLSTMMVPVNTTVIYCYNVYNGTSQTPSIHTLTDSQWGVLLNQLHLDLPPGGEYTYAMTRTITVTTTNTATWTAIQPELTLMARRNLGDKTAAVQPSVLTAQWRTAWLVNPGPQWSTNRSTTATVYVSGPTDDQDHDGIPDNVESAADFDGDNVPNFLDEDADNDGKPDRVEGIVDQDQDGQMDFVDFENRPPDPTNIGANPQEPALTNRSYLPLIVR